MKIDIIVPIYNSKQYIEKLITSTLNQDYNNYELILVDDGSTDGSLEYIKKFTNDKIKVYHIENSGPGLARKYGFEKSNGDLLFFVDSDDWITTSTTLSQINEIFTQNNIDILFFDREDIIDENKEIIESFSNILPGFHKIEELTEKVRPGLGSKIFKRSILTSKMFIDSKVYEDLYTTYKYLDQCTNFYYIKECYYTIYHEKKSNTLSNNWSIETFNKSLDIVNILYKQLKKNVIKKSLTLLYPQLFINYCKKIIKKEYKYNSNYCIENNITEIVNTIKDNKINYNSNKKINKIIYYSMLKFYQNLAKKR